MIPGLVPTEQAPNEQWNQRREERPGGNLPQQSRNETRREAEECPNQEGKSFISTNLHGEYECRQQSEGYKSKVKEENRCLDRRRGNRRQSRKKEKAATGMAQRIQSK